MQISVKNDYEVRRTDVLFEECNLTNTPPDFRRIRLPNDKNHKLLALIKRARERKF